jgi:hypothetical protein
MHTIQKQNDRGEFYVGRMQICERGGEQKFIPMFHGMEIANAIRLANALNGGELSFSDLTLKVLPSLWVTK